MSQQLACPDGSFDRLREAGFNFVVQENKLIVAVPYLDGEGGLQRGYFCEPLRLVDESTVGAPEGHQIYFAGNFPHAIDGSSLQSLINKIEANFPVFQNLTAKWHPSNKKKNLDGSTKEQYDSLYEKVENYFSIIAGPALHKFGEVAQFALDTDLGGGYDSPFIFPDSHSSMAGLDKLNEPFFPLRVAVIGVGGTGAYIVDFLAKTPVTTIIMFDEADFEVKNSFRSPGSTKSEEFRKKKVEVYKERYSTFRKNIEANPINITSENIALIDDSDFVFLCVDDGVTRSEISTLLNERGKRYIDVGLGLEKTPHGLLGQCRVTFVDDETRRNPRVPQAIPVADPAQEIYSSNIQIAEFNAINAALAIIRFKGLYSFYYSAQRSFNSIYNYTMNSIYNQWIP